MARSDSVRSQLVRLGFADPDASAALLGELGEYGAALPAYLGQTADPDAALAQLARIAEVAPDREELLTEVGEDEGTAMRLLTVLGASTALGHHLAAHPEHWHELTDPELGSTRPAAYAMRELNGRVGRAHSRAGASSCVPPPGRWRTRLTA